MALKKVLMENEKEGVGHLLYIKAFRYDIQVVFFYPVEKVRH